MFRSIRQRLLLSYISVIAIVLSVSALGVRVTFSKVLNAQLQNRLETLATAAALELEFDKGDIVVDNEPLVNEHQAIQWFDLTGRLLDAQGSFIMERPFRAEPKVQRQKKPYPAMSITVPVNDYGKGIFIGYVRVSESTQTLHNTLRSLDYGMGVSTVIALVVSGVGSLWLTRQAMNPIEQSFRRLQRFTSDAAHELRSPLAAIKTNASVALKYGDGMRDIDSEKFLTIKEASEQLTALTEDLLMLARFDQNKGQKRDVVSLTDMFDTLSLLYQAPCDHKELKLSCNIQPNLKIWGNAIQLKRLFTNLIDNAMRYTLPSGSITVYTDTQPSSRHVWVHVEDTGIGIEPEHLEQIFDRFWQVDQARSYKAGGFGLGLAIAQSIVHEHKGKISVVSELGKGSRFSVRLPLLPQDGV